ncbi:hypothetical protein GGF50DRAFT_85638 [Schizophyllum commune]
MAPNEDVARPESNKGPRKRDLQATIKRQAKAIDELQKDIAEAHQEHRETLGELKNIQVQLHNQTPGSDTEDEEDVPPRKRQNKNFGREDKSAQHAGKKVTLCYKMWTEPGALGLLPSAGSYNDGEGAEDDDGNMDSANVDLKAKEDAELIRSVCPPHVVQRLNYAETARQIKDGQRVMRTATVATVVKRALDVFGVTSVDFPSEKFESKTERVKLPKVQELMKDNRFMYDRDLNTMSDRLAGFMRGTCILRILRAALLGNAAITTGKPAPKARSPNAKIMSIRNVTPPMLSFAATIAFFVLSGASELSDSGSDGHDFARFYRTQLEKIEGDKKSTATSRQRIERLLSDYTRALFPLEHGEEEVDDVDRDLQRHKEALAVEAAHEVRQQEEREAVEREERDSRAESATIRAEVQRPPQGPRSIKSAAAPSSDLRIGHPPRKRRRISLQWQEGEGGGEHEPTVPSIDSGAPNGQGAARATHQRPAELKSSETFVEYHPHSGLHPKILNEDTPPPIPVLPKTYVNRTPPWHAFGSRADFEQAELFVRFGTTNPQINAQLALNQRRHPDPRSPLKTAQDFHNILQELAREEGQSWQYIKSEIQVDYPKESAPRTYVLHHKRLLPVIRDVLEDEALADRIQTYPERRYVARPGGGLMRVWDELWSGDEWWDMQSKLGLLAFVIYVQLCRVAGIRGPQSYFPCPMCLVHTDELWDLSVSWPKRTVEGSSALIRKANRRTTKVEQRDILSRQSLRLLSNTFIEVFGRQFSVFDMASGADTGGVGFSSVFQIDLSMQSTNGVHHFRHGITELKYITGNEQGQILRYTGMYLNGMFKKQYQGTVLRALRALAVIHLLTKSFKVHTEVTLDYLDEQIKKYDEATRTLRDYDIGLQFNWPKHHSFAHASDIIRRKGPCDNYETGLGERLHPQLKRDYKRSSKRPDTVTEELTQMAKERDVILKIRAEVDQHDAFLETQEDEDEDSDDEDSDDEDPPVERVMLSARKRGMFSLGDTLADFAHLEQPEEAIKHLAGYLRYTCHLRVDSETLDTSVVRQYHLLRTRFVCMMSWRLQVDLIRAKSNWHKQGPRYDGILINVGDDQSRAYEFGIAYAFLNLATCGHKMDLAYVRRFKTIGRHADSDYIMLQSAKVDFVPVDAIERAVHIVPPREGGGLSKYFMVQDLEPDMYLRLKDTIL